MEGLEIPTKVLYQFHPPVKRTKFFPTQMILITNQRDVEQQFFIINEIAKSVGFQVKRDKIQF